MDSTSGENKQELYVRRSSGLIREISGRHSLVFNILSAGMLYGFLNIVWAYLLFPGANLASGYLLATFLNLPIALVYYLFTVSMPRSGGDYIFVSRVLHPSIGFIFNIGTSFALISFNGVTLAWALQQGVSPMLMGLGIIWNNASLVSLGNAVSSTGVVLVVGLLYFLLVGAFLTRRIRTVMKVLMGSFVVSILGYLAYVIGLLWVGHSGFVANFNNYSGMNYSQIINLASNSGFAEGSVLMATLFGMIYAFLNFAGFNSTSYMGGEVKNVQRSQLIGQVGALLIFGGLITVFYLVTSGIMGKLFLESLTYMAINGNSAYTLPFSLPYTNFLIIYGLHSPIVVILANIGFMLTPLLMIITDVLVVSRNMFSWSFDGILPSGVTKIDSKHNIPYVAVIIITVLSVIALFVYLFTPVFNYVVYLTTLLMLTYVVVGIAAIVYPFRRKEIFESSPKIVKIKIGPVPLMSILGFITMVVAGFVTISTFVPAYGGAFTPLDVLYNMLIYPAGLIIYLIAHFWKKNHGIPLEYAFKQLPPL